MAITIRAAFGVRQGPYVWRCTDCSMHGAAARGTEVVLAAHAHLNAHADALVLVADGARAAAS